LVYPEAYREEEEEEEEEEEILEPSYTEMKRIIKLQVQME
jgi:hypothetical protein